MRVKKMNKNFAQNDRFKCFNQGTIQFSYTRKAKTRTAPNTGKIYNESDISLDFRVVFRMERSNVIISFVRSKVSFHLT